MKRIENSVIVPAYNEESGIAKTLKAILKVVDDSYEIIVVDDGSKDRTAEIARKFDVKLVRHKVNKGKGAALKTAIATARSEKIIFIDADNTYPADRIPEVARLLDEYDLVTGTRLLRRPKSMPRFNFIGNKMFANVMRLLYGTNTSDPLSGLRGIRKEAFDSIELKSNDFRVETELTIKAAKMGFTNKDISIDYVEREGETKLNPVQDGLKIARMITYLLRDFNPFAIFLPIALAFLASGSAIGVYLVWYWVSNDFGGGPHTGLGVLSVLLILSGFQVLFFGMLAEVNSITFQRRKDNRLYRFLTKGPATMQKASVLLLVAGLGIGGLVTLVWIRTTEMIMTKTALLSALLMLLGIQLFFFSLLLDLHKRE